MMVTAGLTAVTHVRLYAAGALQPRTSLRNIAKMTERRQVSFVTDMRCRRGAFGAKNRADAAVARGAGGKVIEKKWPEWDKVAGP